MRPRPECTARGRAHPLRDGGDAAGTSCDGGDAAGTPLPRRRGRRRHTLPPASPAAKKSGGSPVGDPPRRGRLAARYFPALLGAVSSPLGPLTAVFGMGTGVTAPPKPPARKVSASRDYIVKPCLTRGGVRRCRYSAPCRACRASWSGGGQAPRPIRMLRVSASPRLRLAPVNPVVSRGPSEACAWDGALRGGLALRCFQRLSLRGVATRPCR